MSHNWGDYDVRTEKLPADRRLFGTRLRWAARVIRERLAKARKRAA
jgi:hypothetical protein